MCGIYGGISRSGKVDLSWLDDASLLLKHRGPDACGRWLSICGRVAFGHRRLSVVDINSSADQPMLRCDGRLSIVFNGEVYNYKELKRELVAVGQTFNTSSDTEVILAAYQYWGEECLNHLNGMFAFAIYDRGDSSTPPTVFLARDRVGEKPLYYRIDSNEMYFASELKAMKGSSSLDLNSLNFYLALGYVPADLCLLTDIKKLPPAHYGRFDLETGALRIKRYWKLPDNCSNALADPMTLAAEAGRLLEESVRVRLEADVPVGVLLSGGLDSSLVTAAAARVSSRPVQTFTIALPGSSLDEAAHAQKVADYFGTQHHVLELERPSLDLLDGFSHLIDEPIADSSILPAWMVFGLARQRVTVALGGDGGDELFGGYTDYTTSLLDQQRFGRYPAALLSVAARIAAQLPAGVRGRNRLASLRGGPLQQMVWGGPYFDHNLREKILKKAAWNGLRESETDPEKFLLSLFLSGTTDMDRMTRTHFGSILPDDFLVKVDRTSMAHSLEVRSPMLDHRLIEFCFSQVPDHWKVKDGQSRRLERLIAKSWLPPDLDTSRKQGFSIPVNEWLRAEGEAKLMSRMAPLPEVFDLDAVRSLVRGHLNGRANGGRLFALIMLAIAMKNLTS